MKIVVLDGYTENPGDLSWDPLAQFGELTVYDDVPENEDETVERIGDAEIVVSNKTKITRGIIDRCPGIRLLAVLATGFDALDVQYAAQKGIPVCNVPAYGTASVAQYAISLLLEICGQVAHHSEAVHQGRWQSSGQWCFWDYPLTELEGKTMGIIGFGRIGQKTGVIAKALGMKILAYNRSRSESGAAIGTYVPLDELLAQSDVIALHCPMSPEMKGIINKNTIARMKDGVIIINNSRGQLVEEQDLADALNSGKVRAAGLDVVSTEPIREDNPLLTAKNCLITPHISWAPKESRQRIMDMTADNIRAFLNGTPQNVVDMK